MGLGCRTGVLSFFDRKMRPCRAACGRSARCRQNDAQWPNKLLMKAPLVRERCGRRDHEAAHLTRVTRQMQGRKGKSMFLIH